MSTNKYPFLKRSPIKMIALTAIMWVLRVTNCGAEPETAAGIDNIGIEQTDNSNISFPVNS